MRWTWMKTVAMILALLGLVLAWQSTVLGLGAAAAAVQAAGGSMSTERYLAILNGWSETYRIVGAVLLGVVLFRVVEPSFARAAPADT